MKKRPFSNASIGSVVLVLTGIGAGLTFGAHAKTNRVTLGLLSEELPAIRSQLSTSAVSGSDTYRTVFSFPGIETADPIAFCPIEDTQKNMKTAITALVEQIKAEVEAGQDKLNPACANISGRLNTSRDQVVSSINSSIEAGSNVSDNQKRANESNRQASAISSFVATTSDVIDGQCLTKNGSKQTVQRLFGQLATLGGLVLGGWPGILIAAAGNVGGRYHFSKTDIEQATSALDRFAELNQRVSYLCHYREMQKLSCLLYSASDSDIFYGNDLTFKSGQTQTTFEESERLRKEDESLYQEIVFLHRVSMNRTITTFEGLMASCGQPDADRPIFTSTRHPKAALDAYANHAKICGSLNNFDVPQTNDEKTKLVNAEVQNLGTLELYFWYLKSGRHPNEITKAVSTYVSLMAYQELKDHMEPIKSGGNTLATDFGALVYDLDRKQRTGFLNLKKDKSLAVTSFEELETKDRHNVESGSLSESTGVAADGIRSRGLKAWLELCQTADPTLVCLYAGSREKSPYFQKWVESCAGPQSSLCKDSAKFGGEKLLSGDPKFLIYLQSLCAVHGAKN